jgi:hypothetical protein
MLTNSIDVISLGAIETLGRICSDESDFSSLAVSAESDFSSLAVVRSSSMNESLLSFFFCLLHI